MIHFNYDKNITLSEVEEQKIIPSEFKKETESAHPGFYKVHLEKPNVDVELSATTRVGIHNYTFNKKENNKILLDLNHRDKVLNSKINIEGNYSISDFRQSEASLLSQPD